MKTTTIALTSKRQCVLPKTFCDRAGLTPNSRLRVTEINGGLYITPISEPMETAFRRVMKLAGGPPKKRFTKKDERHLLGLIHEDRKENRRA